MKKKYIIREVPAEETEFNYYFDDDGFTGKGEDYCYNLFIVAQSRNVKGFNEKEYNNNQEEIGDLLVNYSDIIHENEWREYSSVGVMLLNNGLIEDSHQTQRIEAFTAFFAKCLEKPSSPYRNYDNKFSAFNEEMTAEYLTLKTGKEWATDSAYGYCQGDYVKMVYCKECYKDGAKQYGEIWLGAAKEFYLVDLDENGEEGESCYGYMVADCQARTDEDYKRFICKLEGISEEETTLEMVDGQQTYVKYTYRSI